MEPLGRSRVRTPAIVLAAGVVLACAGCSADAPVRPAASASPAVTAPLPAEISVEVHQARAELAARIVRVRVTNGGDDDLVVRSVELTGGGWATAATSDGPEEAPPGWTADVPVHLGTPACGSSADEPVVVAIELAHATPPDATPGTSTEEPVVVHLVTDPDDPHGVLARARDEDCAGAAIAAGARVSLDADLEVVEAPEGLRVRMTLRLAPVPGGPRVDVDAVDGTTLLTPVGDPQWHPGLTSATGQPVSAVLEATAARCDPHAVAEDKRGGYLPLRARVDGVEQTVTYVPLPETARAALHEFVARACGWPPD
ncbi:hypothetical protein ACGIF2_01900 [Cellulomonas sp. P22]|uniref:hypothetical protein n=1 Tax=Cellulomonas sp. P22 TaxID=3373189 RepID=UPI003789A995